MKKYALFGGALALVIVTLASIIVLSPRPGASKRGLSPDPDTPRPIAIHQSVWIEELTWMEVRDAIDAGYRTVIVPTGGVEQNGPYLATGKHNVILRATTEAIALKLGDALAAPIVPFVPEGDIEPPTRHMRYPGTISIEEETYEALLRDIVRSLRVHGFQYIVLIGDSGRNQDGMREVAKALNREWGDAAGARVIYVPEYYDWPDRSRWLKKKGYREVDQGIHDELSATAMMLSVDPSSVRMEERVAAGLFSINGVDLAPAEETAATGRALVDYIADVTVAAIEKRRNE